MGARLATVEMLIPDAGMLSTFVSELFKHADPGTVIITKAFEDGAEGPPIFPAQPIGVRSKARDRIIFAQAKNVAKHPRPGVFAPPVCTFHDLPGRPRGAATLADVANGLSISVDADKSPGAALVTLTGILGCPTLIVESGGAWTNPDTGEIEPKLHMHWRLEAGSVTRTEAEHARLQEARLLACRIVGGDPTLAPPNHPLRWAGSVHRKGVPKLAAIVERSDAEIDLDAALTALRRAYTGPPLERVASDDSGFSCRSSGPATTEDIASALAEIPNDGVSWDEWNRIGLAAWGGSGGAAFDAFSAWSAKSAKNNPRETAARWTHFDRSPPGSIGAGALFHMANQANPDWMRPSAFVASWWTDDEAMALIHRPKPANDDASGFRPEDVTTGAVLVVPSQEARHDPYALKWHGDADDTPLKEWLVDKMLPKRGTALLSGQWGLYKTFVGFDLSASVMTKTPFAGRPVARQGGVLWLAVEGQDEVRIRLEGVANEKVRPALASGSDAVSFDIGRLPFVWLEACPKLSDPAALPTLRRIVSGAVKGLSERFSLPLGLMMIDTLSPAAQFKDANDTSENQRVMSVLKALAIEFDTLVVAVDHMGKDTSTGTRNSSVKEADVDATLALLGERDLAGNVSNPRMGIRKVRGAKTGDEIKFTRRVVAIPSDQEEDPTTLVIDWATEADAVSPAPKVASKGPWGGKTRMLKGCIERMLIEHGSEQQPFGTNGPRVRAVHVQRVRDEFCRNYAADKPNAKRMAFTRMLSEAVAKGWVKTFEIGASGLDWIWFLKDGESDT